MTNRKVRDTVFCRFMATREHLLSLCNALNDTQYDQSAEININTLEGSFFSNIKNDISFLVDNLMVVLIEHQTTINPNMPLRFLSYVDELYRRYISTFHENIYGREIVKLPAPEFFVFYDGDDTSFEHQTLKLGDAFKTNSDKLELIVNVYNLAEGMNKELKEKCTPIGEYSSFSNMYKKLRHQGLTIDQAINETIRYCLANGIMIEYLQNHQKEVIDMFGFEWNEKEEREALLKIGEARGEARGEAKGKLNATINNIKLLMKNLNLSPEKAMQTLEIAPSEYSRYLAML